MDDTIKTIMETITNRKFNPRINGYDASEVDYFLNKILLNLISLHKAMIAKEETLKNYKLKLDDARANVNRLKVQNETLLAMKDLCNPRGE